MKDIFKIGDKKSFSKVVSKNETATFESGEVHPVYGTFALGRDAEWTCRAFVLEMKEDNEEGIGTFLNITHHSPALVGQKVDFEAEIYELEGNSINCKYTVKVGDRLVASGTQGQKIISKEKIKNIFDSIS